MTFSIGVHQSNQVDKAVIYLSWRSRLTVSRVNDVSPTARSPSLINSEKCTSIFLLRKKLNPSLKVGERWKLALYTASIFRPGPAVTATWLVSWLISDGNSWAINLDLYGSLFELSQSSCRACGYFVWTRWEKSPDFIISRILREEKAQPNFHWKHIWKQNRFLCYGYFYEFIPT